MNREAGISNALPDLHLVEKSGRIRVVSVAQMQKSNHALATWQRSR